MKVKLNKIAVCLLVLGFMMSCSDLDTNPESSTVTEEQAGDVNSKDPAKAMASINGMNAILIAYGANAGSGYHNEYGYPSITMLMETNGQDLVSDFTGYNHFRGALTFADRSYTSSYNSYLWDVYYGHIKAANIVIGMIPAEDKELAGYRGSALAERAFSYVSLAQLFQFTYDGNQTKLAVPLILDTTPIDQLDNPRLTVEGIYEQVLKDLNEAIALMSYGFKRPDKSIPNIEVVYGLKARVHMLMKDWKVAAEYAKKAQVGFTPYSMTDAVSFKFTDRTDGSWMWGLGVSETNRVVTSGIVNWPSFLSMLATSGYGVQTGSHRYINEILWNEIPDTDIRKGWWLDKDMKSPLTAKLPEGIAKAKRWIPFGNLKFGAYLEEYIGSLNASDWPMMRVEEMILNEAEALAMSGDLAGGKKVLESFVKTYRDPSYTAKSSSAEAFQDEVWFQRRVELWGEGFSFFDIMRLRKPIIRYKDGKSPYPAQVIFNLEAEDPILIRRIPQGEINANKAIPEELNNPIAKTPVPVVLN